MSRICAFEALVDRRLPHLLHRLTVEARKAVAESGLSKRELIRALGTSPSQFYRLLDPAYYGKSVGQRAGGLHAPGHHVRPSSGLDPSRRVDS